MSATNDTPDDLLRGLETMLRIRRVEERLSELFSAGKIPGFIHVSSGQEAIAAGVCAWLGAEDLVLTTHRGHGHAVAKGIDLRLFMAEIFGRQDGPCKGRSGSMHVADKRVGVAGANGIVGGGLPIALGCAFAAQYRGERHVTVAFFGDGASNQGTFHEALNLAALWSLPIVFCCENNQWAQFTPQSRYMKIARIADRAAAYGMPGVTVDGTDLREVLRAAGEAVARARRGEGPTLLECTVSRWFGHYVGDAQKYRPQDQVKSARAADPIQLIAGALTEAGRLPAGAAEAMEARIKDELDAAVRFAQQSPPAAGELLADVYA
jgi:acetoin:2,6-dichlorophenolindophenol oxidoreductase subunit alpha